MAVALALLLTVPSQKKAQRTAGLKVVESGQKHSIVTDLKAGLSLVWSDRPLASVLGVTGVPPPSTAPPTLISAP
jgi:hypothetical protein